MFNVLPTFADIAIALVFFIIYFEWTLALVIFFVMAAYGEYLHDELRARQLLTKL